MSIAATGHARRPRWFVSVIAISLLGMFTLAVRPAAADSWTPGQAIGNISGAEKWCGQPWDVTCPEHQSPDPRFNLDLVPWFSTPQGIEPSAPGLMTLGIAQYNHDADGVSVWCYGPVWLWGPVPYWLPLVTNIKRTSGPGGPNEPPPAAAGADVSFQCQAIYVDAPPSKLPFPYFKLFVPVKWWVHKKTTGGDRGWVYITATDNPQTFTPFKVLVTASANSHSLDICTPNSNHESCDPLSGAPSAPGPPSQADLAALSARYKERFRQELGKLLNYR